MIRLFETYEIVTPDSAAEGDAAERGFVMSAASPISVGFHVEGRPDEPEALTFRACVELLRGAEVSCSHPETQGTRAWATAENFREDYRTGAQESRSYHPVSERDARWFWKAYRVANPSRRL